MPSLTFFCHAKKMCWFVNIRDLAHILRIEFILKKHYVKSAQIRIFFGLCFLVLGLNAANSRVFSTNSDLLRKNMDHKKSILRHI